VLRSQDTVPELDDVLLLVEELVVLLALVLDDVLLLVEELVVLLALVLDDVLLPVEELVVLDDVLVLLALVPPPVPGSLIMQAPSLQTPLGQLTVLQDPI